MTDGLPQLAAHLLKSSYVSLALFSVPSVSESLQIGVQVVLHQLHSGYCMVSNVQPTRPLGLAKIWVTTAGLLL